MNLKEFYKSVSGNYDAIIGRFGNEERVKKYLNMFVADETYKALEEAIQIKDFETTFRSVHTLKGLAANLSLDALWKVSSDLTEIFRHYEGAEYKEAFEAVKVEYNKVIKGLQELD